MLYYKEKLSYTCCRNVSFGLRAMTEAQFVTGNSTITATYDASPPQISSWSWHTGLTNVYYWF